MKNRFFISICFSLIFLGCAKLEYTLDYNGTSQSGKHARGVDIKGSKIIISGYKGAVTIIDKSTDQYYKIKDSIANMEDFRDVYLFKDFSYVTINSGDTAAIILDRYNKAKRRFYRPGLFLDGMDFWEDDKTGLIFGDPIRGELVILKTDNRGERWYSVAPKNIPDAIKGEAGFAASGTGIQLLEDSVAYIGTGGGDTARLYKSVDKGEHWQVFNTPMKSGGSFGIYSLHFWNQSEGIITGGSYKDSTYNKKIAFLTLNGGHDWLNISKGLPGYMSCVNSNKDGSLIVVTGRSGTYYSLNKGKSWKVLTNQAFYTVKIDQNLIVLSGKNGKLKIYKYVIP